MSDDGVHVGGQIVDIGVVIATERLARRHLNASVQDSRMEEILPVTERT